MTISSAALSPACPHTVADHLFRNPFCSELSLFEKVAAVVFHILTVFIPLITYHIINWCCPSWFSQEHLITDLKQTIVFSDLKDYSPVAEKAIDFARGELLKNPSVTPVPYEGKEVEPGIARLAGLYFNVHKKAFMELLKENPTNPWENDRLVLAFDACMKIAFAISCLTLDALPAFTAKTEQTAVEALTRQNCYQYRTFFNCTRAYHWARGAGHWEENVQDDIGYPNTIPQLHSNKFYMEGSVQNSWLELYNEYCRRVGKSVDENALKEIDVRFTNWIQEDKGIETFRPFPDTIPT